MAIFRPIWERYAKQFESVRMIYDAEAIFTYRDASLARLRGEQASESNLQSQLRQELELAIGVDCITTVSDHEAQSFKSVLQESLHPTRPSQSGTARKPQTMPQIHVLGHRLEAKATPRGFEQRHGLLFVGALHEDNTPNAESLVWFIDEVWPHLQNQWSALSGTDMRPRSGQGAGLAFACMGRSPIYRPFLIKPGCLLSQHVMQLAFLTRLMRLPPGGFPWLLAD
jgi:hypothetical protein